MRMIWLLVYGILMYTNAFALPDYGEDGLRGLDETQVQKLKNGQIVFTVGESPDTTQASGKSHTFIEAVLIMDTLPGEAWKYLNRTEDQYLYMRETESCKVLYRSLDQILIEYRVKVLLAGTSFRLFHYFDSSAYSMSWQLDPDYENGLKEFRGFWFLYPFDETRTLARYGNYVSLVGIPDFIVRFFMKSGITRSLESVRSYVDSAGVYRK